MKRNITICLIVTILLSAVSQASAVLNVYSDGHGLYPTIQDAVNSAGSGDEIILGDGVYTGIGNRDIDFGGTNLTLRSSSGNPENCIIDCESLGRGFYFHNDETSDSKIEGITIKNGDAYACAGNSLYYGGAIECIEASPAITNCIIEDCTAVYGGAIDLINSFSVIKNCIIKNNTADMYGGAIECASYSDPVIENCLIVNNETASDGAIDCYESSDAEIKNCTVADNNSPAGVGGVFADSTSGPTVTNSIFWGNGDDIDGATATYSCIEDADSGTGNIDDEPMFKTGPLGDYYLSQTSAGQLADSACLNAGNPAYAFDSNYAFDPDFTTRTDDGNDVNTVDMGFHYPTSSAIIQYTLTLTVDANGHGLVAAEPNSTVFNEFAEVELTATADPNYKVSYWLGTSDDNSVSADNLVIMDSDKTVTVGFKSSLYHQLTTAVYGSNGSIDSDGQSYLHNDSADVNAVPDPGYVVKRWYLSNTNDVNFADTSKWVTDSNNSFSAVMSDDMTVAVEFQVNPNNYMFDHQVIDGAGVEVTVNPDGRIEPRKSLKPGGSIVEVTAVPDTGFKVKRWVNADVVPAAGQNTNTVTMTSDKTVQVEFEAKTPYILTTSVTNPANGAITPATGTYYDGDVVELTALPNQGYKVIGWTGTDDDTLLTVNNTVTMNAAKTVTVTFAVPNVIHVPGSYPYITIQDAINQAAAGDIIQIADGTYPGTGFTVTQGITIKGNPEHPENVIIDGSNFNRRIFLLSNNAATIVLNGLTIANTSYNTPTPVDSEDPWDPNNFRNDGANGSAALGAGILIDGSHIITNCIVRDCIAGGSNGRNGYDGNPWDLDGDPIEIPTHRGGYGGDGGDARGGGIYVWSGNPTISNTIIENCMALGGDSGNGGNGLDASTSDPFDPNYPGGPGGNGGNGGYALGGGVCCESGTNPTFTDCVITGCQAVAGYGGDGGLGGVGARGDMTASDPCNPIVVQVGYGRAGHGGVPGLAQGGGVYIDENCNATFDNCQITENIAQGNVGGSGGNSSGSVEHTNSWFQGGLGGLVDIDTLNRVIPNVIQEANDPCYSGIDPNFILLPNQVTITAPLTLGMTATQIQALIIPVSPEVYTAKGGGVYIGGFNTYLGLTSTGPTIADFNNCQIRDNQTQGGTSGIGGFNTGRLVNYNNSSYEEPARHYRVPGFGNGIYLADASATTFRDCDLEDNYYTLENTTDIQALAHDQFIDASLNPITGHPGTEPSGDPRYAYIYGDEYLGYGGGMCFDSLVGSATSATINECNIIDNNTPLGGGIYAQNMGVFNVNDCNFTNNIAIYGGGMFNIDSVPIVTNCRFISNTANASGFIDGPNNIFGEGGAVFNFTSPAVITDCIATENSAAEVGGGFCFAGADGTVFGPEVHNSLITKNTTGFAGGGVCGDTYVALTIANSTIAENMVTDSAGTGGGVAGDYGADIYITDSIIWGNSSVNGSQIGLLNGGDSYPQPSVLNISNSDVDLSYKTSFDFDSNSSSTATSTTEKLVGSQEIYSSINSTGTAKVIVTVDMDSEIISNTDFSSPASVSSLQSQVAALQNQVLSTLAPTDFTVRQQPKNIPIFSGELNSAGLTSLIANSDVAHIEPVRVAYPMTSQGIPLMGAGQVRQDYDGTGMAVAIIDTGVDYTHPMLGGGSFPNDKVIGGYDTANNDADPMPAGDSHGTCCAGIAAGSIGFEGDYIGGVASSAKIYALKIQPDGEEGLPLDASLAAWDWCLTHQNDDVDNPIMVISNSWGIYSYPFNSSSEADEFSPAFTLSAQAVKDAGITMLAASGNDSFAGQGISWPSAMTDIISVGALYDDVFLSPACGVMTTPGQVTCYSNSGDILDIFAPSENAYAPDIVGEDGYDSGDYTQYFNGTSAACPYAAGAVAGLQHAAKEITGAYLTPDQVREILADTGDMTTDSKAPAITKPAVNLGNAIAALAPATPIHTDSGCTIAGLVQEAELWVISDIYGDNIDEDPNFSVEYYLGSADIAGQDDSPCIDAGSDTALALALDSYTTRTDGVNDVGTVDIGYHYSEGLPSYELIISVTVEPNSSGTTEAPYTPGTYSIYQDQALTVYAVPGTNSRVKKWVLDGEDLETHAKSFAIVMNQSHTLTVEFEFYEPSIIVVPDRYENIQDAIDAAEDGDMIYIYPKSDGTAYNIDDPEGLNFNGKAITIRSENPNDPNIVASTVIDCNNNGRAFILDNQEDSNSIIEGLTIINASYAGAIAYGYQQNPYDGNVFDGIDATGDGYGGAIYLGDNTSPIIQNCVFESCLVTGGRGSDGAVGYSIYGDDDERERGGQGGQGGGGYGNGYGGTFYCGKYSKPIIRNCIVNNSTARGGVGGDGGNGGDGDDSKIGGDGGNGGEGDGRGFGGVIYCDKNAAPVIVDCNFTNSLATMGQGGSAGLRGAGTIPSDPPYPYDGIDGQSSGAGMAGAIYYSTQTGVDINDCSIINSDAQADGTGTYSNDGGAIYCEAECTQITIANSTLAGNTSQYGCGGAIRAEAANVLNITECFIGGNTAGQDGGAVMVGSQEDLRKSTLNFSDCAFTDNTAEGLGGAITARNFDADFIDCYVNRNTALSGGGFYFASADCYLNVHGGSIMNNRAIGANAEGGGAYISGMPLDIRNCQVTGNNSAYSGGGILLKGEDTAGSVIRNCLFAENNTGVRGGALMISLDSSATITSCSFSQNGAEPGGNGGAILLSYGSVATIKDSIFADSRRVAIAENNHDSEANISYCMFYDNGDGDFYDDDTSRTYKTFYKGSLTDYNSTELADLNAATDGNNRADTAKNPTTPLFVNGPLGDFYLSQPTAADANINQSNAVNTGSANAIDVEVLADTNMADYTTRIDSNDPNILANDIGIVDMGYHYVNAGSVKRYYLQTVVLGGHGDILPEDNYFYIGTTVELTADPDAGWRVNYWKGTDDDSSTSNTNYVVILSDRVVTVEYEQPSELFVPQEYTALQYAVDDAKNGDKIILAPGTYLENETNYDQFRVRVTGKNITITSSAPDDPCTVAATILSGNGFWLTDVDRSMVVEGITMYGANIYGGTLDCGAEGNHGPSGDGANGGIARGGAVRMFNAAPTFRNCRFLECFALGSNPCDGEGEYGDGGWAGFAWGGAVYMDSESNPIFKNCEFIDCYAQGSNGGDGWHGGNWGDPNDDVGHTWDFAPVGGYEEYWYYSGYGGAIYCGPGGKADFLECLFESNRSYGGVCGLSSGTGASSWPHSRYAIDSFGGAVYIAAGGEVNFTDCNFVDNEAHTRNQIDPSDEEDADLPPTIFDDRERSYVLQDSVISYGGAVCAEGTATPKFKNCNFSSNRACAGGAMYWEDSTSQISSSRFDSCLSMTGGAMCVIDSNVAVFDCNFSNNIAYNPIGQGGAIFCGSSPARFYDCKFDDNMAMRSGGGLYVSGENETVLYNCLITDNTAEKDGGGISANWDTQLLLSNCTLAFNNVSGSGFTTSLGGAISCTYNAFVHVLDSIVWGNGAQTGPAMSVGTNFESIDKYGAELTIECSDIQGGQSRIFVDYNTPGCQLHWIDPNDPNVPQNLTGSSLTAPMFVSGTWGDYYLSQPTDQNEPNSLSPCVDTGSVDVSEKQMFRHTTRTDHATQDGNSVDANQVDMGFHYLLPADMVGDFDYDGDVDDIDSALFFGEYWLNDDCSFPYFCGGRDITEDGEVDFEDYAMFAQNYGKTETTPPSPNPMTWSVKPHSAGISDIEMTATTATDNSGCQVEYQFVVYSSLGTTDYLSWQSEPNLADTNLSIGVQYGYQVRARDERGNMTEWSTTLYAIPGEDSTPPEPNVMTWLIVPEANSPNSVTMTATTAIDDTSGVQYRFYETTGRTGGDNSQWQDSPVYSDYGLDPNTTYSYYVKARDTSINFNETLPSETRSVTTSVDDPNVNDTNAPDYTATSYGIWVSPPQSDDIFGEPGQYYHFMSAVVATDSQSPPVWYFFENVSGGGESSGWVIPADAYSSELDPMVYYNSGEVYYRTGPYFAENHGTYQVWIMDNSEDYGTTGTLGNYVISSEWHTRDDWN